jgi:hypothetical protein
MYRSFVHIFELKIVKYEFSNQMLKFRSISISLQNNKSVLTREHVICVVLCRTPLLQDKYCVVVCNYTGLETIQLLRADSAHKAGKDGR